MSAPLRVGFVIPVGPEAHEYIRRAERRLRERYGANAALDESPHITLKQAFEVATVEPFEGYLDRLAGDVEPFEVVLRGVGVFERGILFLDVARDPRLEALRQRVLRDLSAEFGVAPYQLEDGRYRFHVTLATGLSDADADEARRALEADAVEFRFGLERLALLCHTGTRWITYARATAGHAASGPRTPAGASPPPSAAGRDAGRA